MATDNTSMPSNKPRRGLSEKGSNRLTRVLLIVLFVGVLIYSVITFATTQSQLSEKRKELESINKQIEIQEIKNEEMNKLYNYSGDQLSDYIEQIARDELDYVKQGERVFVNVSGD